VTEQYELLRSEVIGNVRLKLAARGMRFPELDLEAWYNAAWHGLYVLMAERGERIENPGGWLVVTMERRAIDEVRHTKPDKVATVPEGSQLVEGSVDVDFAERLDDLDRLRRWRSAARLRLTRREREAAVLHLIRGYSRIETAELLGVPTKRADKIFDSITKKTSGLLRSIEDGSWCERQRSLMTAFAAGVLDPAGERYAIAKQHLAECPGCAAWVRRQRNAYLILPAPAVAGVATLTSGGAIGAALGLGSSGVGAGAGAGFGASGVGAAGSFLGVGGLITKTAVVCVSAVCLSGAGIVVEKSVHHAPHHPRPAKAHAAAGPPTSASPRTRPIATSNVAPPTTATTPTTTSTTTNNTLPPPSTDNDSSANSPPDNSKPSDRDRVNHRAAHKRVATAERQESEIGIESAGGGSTSSAASPPPSTAPPSSGASGTGPTAAASSAGSSSPPSSSSSSSSASSSSSPPAPRGGSSGSNEFGIEP
jgi:DNA-directed RNA polymerase specialized sigma24 family protein